MYIVPRVSYKRGTSQGMLWRISVPLEMNIFPCLLYKILIIPCLPCQNNGIQETPGYQVVFWQCLLFHGCHAKKGESKECQAIYPIPWQGRMFHTCHDKFYSCPTPATQKSRSPRNAGRIFDPLTIQINNVPHFIPDMQKKRSPRATKTYIRFLGYAYCPTPAMQKRRSLSDARPYFGPLVIKIVLCLPRKRGGAQGTPGRSTDSLTMQIGPHLP